MKFTKMSLVAALLIGSSAFAIENTKVSGNAKLYYSTTDALSGYDENVYNKSAATPRKSGDLFSKDSSAADIAVNLNVTTDLFKNDTVAISAGAGYTVLTTLGLENNLVSGVWGSSHTATGSNSAYGAKVENANWMTEAWIAATAGKTTVKLGRMELDTPLVFTEKWSIEKNTFEAVVVVNQDIPDTTLVGAYVGNGNGTTDGKVALNGTNTRLEVAAAGVVNTDGKFTTYGTDGAYAVGIVNNSVKPLTVQAWYYDLTRLATAYWLQADLNMEGILAGAQYTAQELKASGSDTADTYALMLGYEMKDVATIKVAYSDSNDKGALTAANTATSTGASKLYTEAWWNYGYVTAKDTTAWNVAVEGKAAGIDLGAYYTQADQGTSNGAKDIDMKEFTVTAGKSFGPLDATVAYIYTKADDQNDNTNDGIVNGEAYNMIQAYLTLNF